LEVRGDLSHRSRRRLTAAPFPSCSGIRTG
jgi:hypothetical protein